MTQNCIITPLFRLHRVMPHDCPSPDVLPRIRGAVASKHDSPRMQNAADTASSSSVTAEWTGPAALRRIYAPSLLDKHNAWCSRSTMAPTTPLPSSSLVLNGMQTSRGQAHHLAPLDTRTSAQQRYNVDAVRFLAALEESQRTALKFEEHRHRTYLERSAAFRERLVGGAALEPSPTLSVDDAEVPREAQQLNDAARPSPADLRPQREGAAGQLVDEVIELVFKEWHSRQRRNLSHPQLTATEQQLPTLTAKEVSVPTPCDELRRLRSALADSLLDAWWPGFDAAAATAPRKHSAAEGEGIVLRGMSIEAPRTPSQEQQKRRRSSSVDGLRRVRKAAAANWVNELIQSTQFNSLFVQLHCSETALPSNIPSASTLPEREDGAKLEADEAPAGARELNTGASLQHVRRDQAAAWLEVAPRCPDTQLPILHAENQEGSDTIRSSETQNPHLDKYVTKRPLSPTRDVDLRRGNEKDGADGLRLARQEEAMHWVREALREQDAKSIAVSSENDEHPGGEEEPGEDVAPLHSSESQLPRLAEYFTETPHSPMSRKTQLSIELYQHNNDDDGLRRARHAEAAAWVFDALQPYGEKPALRAEDEEKACSVRKEDGVSQPRSTELQPSRLTEYDTDAPHSSVDEVQREDGGAGLLEARMREASAWVAHALSQSHRPERTGRSGSAGLAVLRSFAAKTPRSLHATEEMTRNGDTKEGSGLRQARLAEARALVETVLQHPRQTTAAAEGAEEAPQRFLSAERERPPSNTSASPLPQATIPGNAAATAAAWLYDVRRALAEDLVHEAYSAIPVKSSSAASKAPAKHRPRELSHPAASPRHGDDIQPALSSPQHSDQQRQSPCQGHQQVVGELTGSLSHATKVLCVDASENLLSVDAALFVSTVPLRASFSAAAAHVRRAPQKPLTGQQEDRRSGGLYASRHALARFLVADWCGVPQKVSFPPANNVQNRLTGLREARLREATNFVSSVM